MAHANWHKHCDGHAGICTPVPSTDNAPVRWYCTACKRCIVEFVADQLRADSYRTTTIGATVSATNHFETSSSVSPAVHGLPPLPLILDPLCAVGHSLVHRSVFMEFLSCATRVPLGRTVVWAFKAHRVRRCGDCAVPWRVLLLVTCRQDRVEVGQSKDDATAFLPPNSEPFERPDNRW